MSKLQRPILRYHGGKWVLAKWVIGFFPQHRIYVEPYGGAASVLFQKERSFTEVYNDLDDEVVNVFQQLRDHGPALKELIKNTPYGREEYHRAYARARSNLERARRTIVKTFMGFGSDSLRRKNGFRKRSDASGTTPAHDWMGYAASLDKAMDRLRGVVIERRDALLIIKEHDSPETLFYIDPPYVRSTRTSKGYKHEMTDEEHRELAKVLHEAQGAVVVSGYHSTLYDELYADWSRAERGAFADGASARIEVVWYNRPSQSMLL